MDPRAPVPTEVLEATIQRESQRRLEEMQSLAELPLGATAVPEDGTLATDAFHMVIRAGNGREAADLDVRIAQEMIRVASEEGAQVVIRTNDPGEVLAALSPSERQAVKLIQVDHKTDV